MLTVTPPPSLLSADLSADSFLSGREEDAARDVARRNRLACHSRLQEAAVAGKRVGMCRRRSGAFPAGDPCFHLLPFTWVFLCFLFHSLGSLVDCRFLCSLSLRSSGRRVESSPLVSLLCRCDCRLCVGLRVRSLCPSISSLFVDCLDWIWDSVSSCCCRRRLRLVSPSDPRTPTLTESERREQISLSHKRLGT